MSAGSNSFGELFRFTSFGESHGPAMGVVIDGCPAGVAFNEALLLKNLARRRPGQSEIASPRNEPDQPEILSGVFENKTLGTPIAVIVRNKDARSEDYALMKTKPRLGHADDLWADKFGHNDPRGGGRASARETINWVIAGSLAQMLVGKLYPEVTVQTELSEVGGQTIESEAQLHQLITQAKQDLDSLGAKVRLQIDHPPRGIGEPVFQKFKAKMAQGLMGLNAVCAVELGLGTTMAKLKGSELHKNENAKNYGGERGGISTGESIIWTLSFKPTATIGAQAQAGRHDPCVAVRALGVIEAMAWNVMADLMLSQRLNQV